MRSPAADRRPGKVAGRAASLEGTCPRADSARTVEAPQKLVQANALFDQSKMTVQRERAKQYSPNCRKYDKLESRRIFPASELRNRNIVVPQDKKVEARGLSSSKLSVLRKHPIFSDLEPEALDQLCRYAKHTTLKRGATIFSRGDPGNCLFAVITGTVKMSISSVDGRSAIFNLIGAGEIFGEIALLDGLSRSADAIANGDCELFVIDRREFIPFVRSQPALAMKIIELLCTRLRWTSDQVEQIILQNLPCRLASALIRLTEKNKLAPGGRTIAMTQQEVSEMVGMTRESINKQLRAWAVRGWVRLEHGAIVILNTEALQELAEAGSDDGD